MRPTRMAYEKLHDNWQDLTDKEVMRFGGKCMKNFCCLIALTLLIVSSLALTASSQEQVAWTVYIHEGNLNGTMLSNVQVTGQDAAGNGFQGITDSNGVVVISGQPGTWQFSFTKESYDPLSLNYNVTETGEGAVYLQRTVQS
jgi:hypothetical protein